jgi:SET domain-containing protein
MTNSNKNVYIKETKNKGKSLFANKSFKKGEFIFLVAGPIVNKGTIYTIPITKNLFIDPVPVDNFGKYLCHSCDPNAGIKQRTMVVAFKDIKKDEEITIDYAMIVGKYGDEMTPENIICKCGSKNCRGELGSWFKLPKKIKEKYKGYVSEYLISKK